MELAKGTKLGPYEIQSPLGAGGMGEVYRARDERLGREVAVKVLPGKVAGDPARLRRFEQEARAAGQLNHPNIMAVYDAGEHEGSPYVVFELLEGETLRQRMGGTALSSRRAVEYALQIAHGLAAAHEKGIVHRDLKPENVFVTRDGRVKILDFGLAKLTQNEADQSGGSQIPTMEAGTGPGVVMGTVGYMSPEQVRGRPADHRSDIFSFGTILYEMLSGRRPFEAESSVELMNAILKEDPPELSSTGKTLSPGLDRIVRHCMEKSPEQRFQSARDLAFHLEALSGDSVERVALPAATRGSKRIGLGVVLAIAAIAAVAGLGGGLLMSRHGGAVHAPPEFRKITYREGTIFTARFAPDGDTVIYGAAWSGEPMKLYSARRAGGGSRALDLPPAEILSISKTGEMAILVGRRILTGWSSIGTLARVPLAGGAPKMVMEETSEAEWAPSGGDLAVARYVDGTFRLEYPPGKVLHQSSGWISNVRFSPDGRRIAFVDHPGFGDDLGHVAVVDLEGHVTSLTNDLANSNGLAWRPDGTEILYSAATGEGNGGLFAVGMGGGYRQILSTPSSVNLMDIADDGTFLFSAVDRRRGIVGRAEEASAEKNLSWMDWTRPVDISSDGNDLLLEEQGAGGGPRYSMFIRTLAGSPAVYLGDGLARALSPDGRWALSVPIDDPETLVLVPTGPGEKRTLKVAGLKVRMAEFHPDGERIFFLATREDGQRGVWSLPVDDGTPEQIVPADALPRGFSVSPDGTLLAEIGVDDSCFIYPLDGGKPRPVKGIEPNDILKRFSEDRRALYVAQENEVPAKVYEVDLQTGERRLLMSLQPADRAGVIGVDYIRLGPGAKSYVYSYRTYLSQLYVAEDIR